MERKVVIHKGEHELFKYGHPYFADVTHGKLRIIDKTFTGNRYTVYDLNKFYYHNELDKATTENNVLYNRCITMKFLIKHKNYLILRGLYFMSGDGEVQEDGHCYYIHDLTNKNNNDGDNGLYIDEDHDEDRFPSEEFAVDYIKRVINGDTNVRHIMDLDGFGGGYFYIMNTEDMIKEETV